MSTRDQPDPWAAGHALGEAAADAAEAADQANLDGYQQGYGDGYADARALDEELLDQLRLILWRHHQALAARDASIQPPQVLGIYRHTLAELPTPHRPMTGPRIGIPGPKARPVLDRLVEKIEITDACWQWVGKTDISGYGTLLTGSRLDGSRRHGKAHRLLWELVVGPVPDGLDLDHLCRNRQCVNPDHLEPVTRQVNLLRGSTIPATNAAKTHCIHGHPFTIENTYVGRDGARVCRACKARQQRDRRARRATLR